MLLLPSAIYFGHLQGATSLTYVYSTVIDDWHTIYKKYNTNTMMTVIVLIGNIQIGRYNVEECF